LAPRARSHLQLLRPTTIGHDPNAADGKDPTRAVAIGIDTPEGLATEIGSAHARIVASARVKQVVMHIGSDGRKNMRPIPLSDATRGKLTSNRFTGAA
jgi:hypothetical protein